jgi:glycosyltransferase involved in cell wall biosynthesis
VGRLSPEKGFDALIRAIVRLRRAGNTVSLWIAGEGDARVDLERLIAELGCGGYVRLLGHVADPRAFYEALDLYVLSSIREGLPNVVLEAMAMEVPVVATRVAGVPTLIEDGISGVIVKPASIEALQRGIERLIAEPALCEAQRSAARLRVESQFSFERRMQKVATIYNNVLGRSPAVS